MNTFKNVDSNIDSKIEYENSVNNLMKKAKKESHNNLKKKRIIAFVLLFVQVVVLLGLFTYAWFGSDSDPVIVSDQLNIASSEGLYIELVDDNSERELKSVIRDYNAFKLLSQMSTVDGKTMYKRLVEDDIISYVPVTTTENYVEGAVMLMNGIYNGTNVNRAVYIKQFELKFFTTVNNDGEIEDVEIVPTNYIYDALRLSIEIEETSNSINNMIIMAFDCYETDNNLNKTITVNKRRDYELNNGSSAFDEITQTVGNKYYTLSTAVARAGLSDETPQEARIHGYETSTFLNCLGEQKVYYISNFIKGNVNFTRNLTVIDMGRQKKFTFRLWLEGGDPECNVDLTGTKFWLKITFDSDLVATTSSEFIQATFGN